jgi:hypothetical protein
MPIDAGGNEYFDLVGDPRVVDMTSDPEIERMAQHPATRAMISGLDRMNPQTRTAWLHALRSEMGDAGAASVVAMIGAAKRPRPC